MVVVHSFNPSTQKAEAEDPCEFKASLIYRASSRKARAVTQRNPISKKPTITTTTKQKIPHFCTPTIWEAEAGGSQV